MKKAIGFFLASVVLASCATTPERPSNKYEILQTANQYVGAKEYGKAWQAYAEYLKLDDDRGIRERMISLMFREKDYAATLQGIEDYEKRFPITKPLALLKADAWIRLGLLDRGLSLVGATVGLENPSPEAIFKHAEKIESWNASPEELRTAYELYSICIALDGGHVMAHNNRAYVLLSMKQDLDLALQDASYPIAAFANDAASRRLAGNILYAMGDYGKALTRYQEALDVYGKYGEGKWKDGEIEILMGIARSYVKLGDVEAGKRHYQKAADLGSQLARDERNGLK